MINVILYWYHCITNIQSYFITIVTASRLLMPWLLFSAIGLFTGTGQQLRNHFARRAGTLSLGDSSVSGFSALVDDLSSFPLLSSSDNNFKRGKAGGPLERCRPAEDELSPRDVYRYLWLPAPPSGTPYRSTVLFFRAHNAFVLANSTSRASRWIGDGAFSAPR